MTLHLKAETEDAGTRLDAFVASRANGLTRSQAARYIEEGRVSVGGKAASKSCRIGGGETVTVDVPEVRETALEPQDIPLDVVYEDEDVIVVNKPSGLVVHPAPGHPDGTLVNALLHHCGSSLSGIGGEKRPGIVHRIDKDTSGLLIAAKNDFAHLALSAQLADHTMARTYEAVVCGNLRDDAGTLHLREHLCICLIGFLERIAFSYRGLKLCCTPLNQAVHSKRVNDQKHEESECGKDPFLIIRPQCGPICVIEIGVRPCF